MPAATGSFALAARTGLSGTVARVRFPSVVRLAREDPRSEHDGAHLLARSAGSMLQLLAVALLADASAITLEEGAPGLEPTSSATPPSCLLLHPMHILTTHLPQLAGALLLAY